MLDKIMGIPIFLIIFISATITIQIKLRKNKSGFKESCEEFFEREKLADNTIKKDFTDFPYIYADKASLPIKEYSDDEKFKRVIKRQEQCIKKSQLEMIYLDDEYSNTDLKLKYGKNNLEKITFLESHYNNYILSLLEWAKELISLDNKEDAKRILNEAVKMKANVSQIYILLADLNENDMEFLKGLKEKAEENKVNLKEKTIKYIEDKMN